MTRFMQDLKSFSEQIARDNDIAAVTIQVVDRSDGQRRMLQVLDFHVPQEAPWRYREELVYHQDPFTDVALNEAPDVAATEDIIFVDDPRIQALRPQCPSYWDFLAQFDLSVEGVSTRRLRRGIYLVAGYLRDRRRTYASLPSRASLNASSPMLHNMVAAEVLQQAMQSNAGHLALQRIFGPAEAAAAGQIELLSVREMEVARLIAAGRQTKQVAHDLGLSQHTIENHLRRIYAKLSVHNRATLASLIN